MYQLSKIGEIYAQGKIVKLKLNNDYKRGLKYSELFSHMHVFYMDVVDNSNLLLEAILKIVSVDRKSGVIEFLSNGMEWSKAVVFDLKPYFPCEDSVKVSSYSVKNIDNKLQIKLSLLSLDKGIYEMGSIGLIKHHNGKKYIEFNSENLNPELEGCSHIKVIWWFHKYDEAKYRKCVECEPPYENAPRTGVFATRSPVRPNPIAMTIAKITERSHNRIYVNEIECFEGTPCITVWPYQQENDLIVDAKVPKWLEHWPKWLDDRSYTTLSGEIITKASGNQRLFEQDKEMTQDELDHLFSDNGISENADGICIEGARENNLKGINCMIPYHKITAVVGVSGSGKSSLVQDTIYAECQRRMIGLTDDKRIIEKPKIDGMYGSIPAVMISQKEIGKSSRSTVGTYSNAYDYLRVIFALVGIRHCPECGKPIIPQSQEEILALLVNKKDVVIYDLDKNEISEGTLDKRIKKALEISKGALYAKMDEGDTILLQTTQKCYQCDRLMFALTPATFNYSDLESMCPVCNGYGEKKQIDLNTLVERPQLSILEGASSWWGKLRSFISNPSANWMKGEVIGLAEAMKVDLEQPWNELPFDFRNKLLYGSSGEVVTFHYSNKRNGRNGSISRPVEGVYHILERLYMENGDTGTINKYLKRVTCDCCHGERLNAEGRLVSIGDSRYPQVAQMTFHDVLLWCKELPKILNRTNFEIAKENIQRLYKLSSCAIDLGIGHLELDRNTATLSGGEGQRMKFLSSMQNQMSGILYVFDEPSKGLHPKDYYKIANMIKSLKKNRNTVIMVEHNEDMIKIADYLIEIGPNAGEKGGYLIGEGSLLSMLKNKDTQISRYMKEEGANTTLLQRNFNALQWLKICGASYNNLKNIDVSIPINAITCICGVSGSGKSSLMKGVMYPELTRLNNHQYQVQNCRLIKNAELFDHIVMVEQSAIGRTPRSVPATYVGIIDAIRKLFAETEASQNADLNSSAYSFNSTQGHCENCHGDGQIMPEFSQDIWVTCPICKGKRYKRIILSIEYKGKNIAEVLDMSIEEACEFFGDNAEINKVLQVLKEVGLGYLKLGQSSVTLSGGEASRLKLAKELISKNKKNTLYLIDEPTTGLHFSDITNLIYLLHKLVKEGNTVVLIEHNKQVIRNCDWIIELGPGAGKEGGYIISQEKNHE